MKWLCEVRLGPIYADTQGSPHIVLMMNPFLIRWVATHRLVSNLITFIAISSLASLLICSRAAWKYTFTVDLLLLIPNWAIDWVGNCPIDMLESHQKSRGIPEALVIIAQGWYFSGVTLIKVKQYYEQVSNEGSVVLFKPIVQMAFKAMPSMPSRSFATDTAKFPMRMRKQRSRAIKTSAYRSRHCVFWWLWIHTHWSLPLIKRTLMHSCQYTNTQRHTQMLWRLWWLMRVFSVG